MSPKLITEVEMIEQITSDLRVAMKEKNKPKIIGLRNLLGKLKAKQIDKGSKLDSDECIKILMSASKQLKDSIEQYKKANRLDLAEKEIYELSLVKNYLPEPINDKKLRKIVITTIKENNAKSMADMGKIMGIIMSKLSGSVDGNIVQQIVREELNK